MYATSDLDTGIEEVKDLTGVVAEFGGAHPGGGTRNALMSFGDEQYLEIIAPDPGQETAGTLGEELLNYHRTGGIRTWAVAVNGFDEVRSVMEEMGYTHHTIDMTRTRPDGVKLSWQILFVGGHPYENRMPFFIDWLASPHPANDCPPGCRLAEFTVCLLENHLAFRAMMEKLGLDVKVLNGPDAMRAVIDSPAGRVMLH